MLRRDYEQWSVQIIRTDLGLDLSVAARVANANMPYAVSQKKVYFFIYLFKNAKGHMATNMF